MELFPNDCPFLAHRNVAKTYFCLLRDTVRNARIHRLNYPRKWRVDEASFYDNLHDFVSSRHASLFSVELASLLRYGFTGRLDICGLYVIFPAPSGVTAANPKRPERRWRSRGIAEITMCGPTGRVRCTLLRSVVIFSSLRASARAIPPFVGFSIYSAPHSLPLAPYSNSMTTCHASNKQPHPLLVLRSVLWRF